MTNPKTKTDAAIDQLTSSRGMVNLASPHLGSRAAAASDEFFAPAMRMLATSEPVFKPDVYDDHGKWMDGWETRRRRGGGEFDWALIRLGAPGEIAKVDLNTCHFTGNYPPFAELHGCMSESPPDPDDSDKWRPIVAKTDLAADSHNWFDALPTGAVNWIRLRIYPDGGIARLRLYGHVRPEWNKLAPGEIVELSAMSNGGRVLAYSDAHYGDVHAILSDRRARNMGDGWETRRRRDGGVCDWIIIGLGHAGAASSLVVDTAFFRGNYPEFCDVSGGMCDLSADEQTLWKESESWDEILPRQKLESNNLHRFGRHAITTHKAVNAVRLNIYPDGGVSRFRFFGAPD